MKQFRPYHFPPLAQFIAAGVAKRAQSSSSSSTTTPDEEWQSAIADGYRQGQREGYEVGLDEGRNDGYDAGHAEGVERGVAEGRQQALTELEQMAKPVDAMLRSLKKLKTEFRNAQRKEVVDLVGKIARQVIRAELALQPVQMLNLVDEALAAMPPTREDVEVFMNPEELKRIQELDPKRAKKWNLMSDPALDLGECRVRAGDHEVDAGCQNRLAACMTQVRESLDAAAKEDAQ